MKERLARWEGEDEQVLRKHAALLKFVCEIVREDEGGRGAVSIVYRG